MKTCIGLHDHLGTITHVTNKSGTVLNEYSFDSCDVKLRICEPCERKPLAEHIPKSIVDREGLRRNFSNWSYAVAAQTDLLPARGFTGHEWLPWFNLYNMNGRLYDPVVGRFLSPDNYVQMPDFSQNFNRYSYCLNNPLKYNDPDGEWFVIDDLISFIGGGIINVVMNAHNINNFWEGLSYFASGGVGTWISVQSFGLAVPVGNAITTFGNSLTDTNFLTKEKKFSFKSITNNEWEIIGKRTAIGAGAGLIGGFAGDKISKGITGKLNIESKFWNKAIDNMAEKGITQGLERYGESTWINENKLLSKEAFSDLGIGFGTGVLAGFTQSYIEEKWIRPELSKLKDLKAVLNLKTSNTWDHMLNNSYNPAFPHSSFPSYIFPPSKPVRIPHKR